jgi:hypothetical protein
MIALNNCMHRTLKLWAVHNYEPKNCFRQTLLLYWGAMFRIALAVQLENLIRCCVLHTANAHACSSLLALKSASSTMHAAATRIFPSKEVTWPYYKYLNIARRSQWKRFLQNNKRTGKYKSIMQLSTLRCFTMINTIKIVQPLIFYLYRKY